MTYNEKKSLYENIMREIAKQVKSLLNEAQNKDNSHNEFGGTFDLNRNLIEDFPEYEERLLNIDFPVYEKMTYKNVLEFFKNVYGFNYSWNYQYAPSTPYDSDDAYEWLWSARIPGEDKSKGVSSAFATFGYEFKNRHECENSEQEAIMSIIEYITNRIENLEF